MKINYLLFAIILSTVFVGCNGTNISKVLGPANPYDQYKDRLKAADLDNSALAKDWINAGETVFVSPLEIELPYQELTRFDSNQPQALYLEYAVREGQEILIKVRKISQPDSRFFVDVFEWRNEERKNIHFSKDSLQLNYSVKNSGRHGVRIQPELFRGGIVELSIQFNPTLAFPVVEKDYKNIASFFGDGRDGGRRKHEGVDVFATKGTPVTAVVQGRVSRVGTNNLGGKTVSIFADGYSYYYAHLDSQLAQVGQRVRKGDTLGTVGNTGNAITTPPHLHFGIYRQGRGAVDPFPFLAESEALQPLNQGDTTNLGSLIKTSVAQANMRSQPNSNSEIVRKLPQNTIARIISKKNDWYKIQLPDGSQGFVFENLITANLTNLSPINDKQAFTASESLIRTAPFPAEYITGDLQVIGEFDLHQLVKSELGNTYWLISQTPTTQ